MNSYYWSFGNWWISTWSMPSPCVKFYLFLQSLRLDQPSHIITFYVANLVNRIGFDCRYDRLKDVKYRWMFTNWKLLFQTLHHHLSKKYPNLVNPNLHHGFYFIHRLDFVTSGAICIALHKKACSVASIAFQKRATKKYYLALLRGHVSSELFDIGYAIGKYFINSLLYYSIALLSFAVPFMYK